MNSGLATNAVAKHDSRSRKRRPARSGARAGKSAPRRSAVVAPPAARAPGAARGAGAAAERPQAPWHPLPLSELLILVGAIATVIGLSRSRHGFAAGGPTLLAGVGAVLIGTVEVALREHRGGYRSHTLILSLLPVIVFHTAVVLIVAAFVSPPRALTIGLLPVDVALFAILFKLLRARFADARRERNFAAGR
ncbi:MAG TPA: hypothetical protein VIH92_10085 [Solirubrobacteraceae bacterium]